MTINPIKRIRNNREWKRHEAEWAQKIHDQKIRYETIEWMIQNGHTKNNVS